MNKELDKIKEIFLTEVDEDIRQDNLDKINEWEQGLTHNEAFVSWQDHDITKEILKQAKESYREIALILADNRKLTEEQRYALWGKQDACAFIIDLAGKDAKGELEQIQKEIKTALSINTT